MQRIPALLASWLRGMTRLSYRLSLSSWALPSLGLALAAIGAALAWYVYATGQEVLQNHLVESAEKQATAVTRFRDFYAEQVLAHVAGSGFELSHLYKERDNGLPLSVTLVMDFGKYWESQSPGEKVSLFSEHPFPWRERERQLDGFQTEALAHLKLKPDEPFVRRDVIDGLEVLRYAKADRMRDACVACHNSHGTSPKTNWRVGDVRGALEVTVPVHGWHSKGEQVLSRSVGVLIGVGLLGLGMVWLITLRLQLALKASRQLSSEREHMNARLRQEIADRLSTERNLRLSEGKLQGVFQSAPEGIVVMDTFGVILQANLAAAAMFDSPLSDLIGQNVGHFIVMDAWADASDGMATGIPSGLNKPQVVKGLRGNGDTFPLRLSMSQTRVDNQFLLTGVMQDFTQVKANEAQLEEARVRAEVANRLKGELLANMSHEIRTPMNGIVGMTQLVLDTPLADAQRQNLELAQTSAHHLLHIINDILDLSKIESGSLELEPLACSPGQILLDTVKSLAPLAEQKSLALETSCAADVPHQLMLDPVRLRQIVTNLVGNAIKFTAQGSVQVFVEAEVMDTGRQRVQLLIRVKDSGIGFDPSEAEAIFRPSVQADGTSIRAYGGTGLGLAITRSLVALMGGDISAGSVPGQGAEFRVRIPCELPGKPAAGQRATEEFSDTPPLRPLHILLAEDHPVNRMLAGMLLTQIGHSHATACNGQEALDLHAQQAFDLVLMDVMMPLLDGLGAMAEVRKREAGGARRTPIIVVTAHAMTGDRERFLAAGADGYVSKPISAHSLQAEMLRVMEAVDAAGVSQARPNLLSPPADRVD